MSLPSTMADFVPCDHLLQKAYCLTKGIVYQVQVMASRKTKTYVGLTAAEFKARFRNHQVSFNNETIGNGLGLTAVNKILRITVKVP